MEFNAKEFIEYIDRLQKDNDIMKRDIEDIKFQIKNFKEEIDEILIKVSDYDLIEELETLKYNFYILSEIDDDCK